MNYNEVQNIAKAAMQHARTHISRPGSPFGFKRENIYYFDDGILTEL